MKKIIGILALSFLFLTVKAQVSVYYYSQGNEFTFHAMPLDSLQNPTYNYEWIIDGQIFSGETVQYSRDEVGTFEACVEATFENNTYADCVTVDYQLPELDAYLTYYFDENNPCSTTVYTNIVDGVAPYTYLWEDGQTESFIENCCENDVVSVTITDDIGQELSLSTTIIPIPDSSFYKGTFKYNIDSCLNNITYAEVISATTNGMDISIDWRLIADEVEINLTFDQELDSLLHNGNYLCKLELNCSGYKSVESFTSQFEVANGVNSIESAEKNMKLNLSPNPATDRVVVSINSDFSSQTTVEIINYTGQIIRSFSTSISSGNNSLPISLDGLSSGFYIVNIKNSLSQSSQKLIIK